MSVRVWEPVARTEGNPNLTSGFNARQAELQKYEDELREWAEKEASVCPENVGFVETIQLLRQENHRLKNVVARMMEDAEGDPDLVAQRPSQFRDAIKELDKSIGAGVVICPGSQPCCDCGMSSREDPGMQSLQLGDETLLMCMDCAFTRARKDLIENGR